LADQAKILYAEAEENNLDGERAQSRWDRWNTCSLCEQQYHGVVACALGWACWKTYVGRPEADVDAVVTRFMALTLLGAGLNDAGHHEDALTVQEAELSTRRRVGAPEEIVLVAQNNLANTYQTLGRSIEALPLRRDVYSGFVKIYGEESLRTLTAANNYAACLNQLRRFEEARSLLRGTIPVARRVLGESNDLTLRMRLMDGVALYVDPAATLDALREAVTTLEDARRTAQRVCGGTHPLTVDIEGNVQDARAELAAREGDDVSSVCDGVAAMAPRGA
jgi:hypothetical protein